MKKINGLYILGTGRSGTTMMNKLISSHPEIVGVMQAEILKKFTYKFKSLNSLIKSIAESEEEFTFVKNYFKNEVKLSNLKKTNPYEFMHNYCCAHAQYSKKKYYSEKSPIHSLFAKEIIEKIPNSKILIVMRDPRSTIFSKDHALTANRGKIYNFPKFLRHNLNLSEVLFTYEYFNRLYKEYKNSENIYFMKYENLVLNPDKELKTFFNFLGLEYFPVHKNFKPDDIRLKAKGRDKDSINSSFSKEKKVANKNILSKNSVDRWKKGLTKREILIIESSFSQVAPLIKKDFYPDIKKESNITSKILISLSKLDKYIFIKKNIGVPSKVKLY